MPYACPYLNIDYGKSRPGTYRGAQILTASGKVLESVQSRDYKVDLVVATRAALLLADSLTRFQSRGIRNRPEAISSGAYQSE
jgi:hypothetical protein